VNHDAWSIDVDEATLDETTSADVDGAAVDATVWVDVPGGPGSSVVVPAGNDVPPSPDDSVVVTSKIDAGAPISSPSPSSAQAASNATESPHTAPARRYWSGLEGFISKPPSRLATSCPLGGRRKSGITAGIRSRLIMEEPARPPPPTPAVMIDRRDPPTTLLQ
jgi:hypothetical protein